MSHGLRIIPALAALACALGAAGCGGGAGQATLTRAQLVAKADPICKEVAAKRVAANKTVTTLATLAKAAPPVAADEQQAINTLRHLKVTGSVNHDWQELLAGMQELATDAKRVGTYAKSNNGTEVERIVSAGRVIRQNLTTIATRNGFKYCGIAS